MESTNDHVASNGGYADVQAGHELHFEFSRDGKNRRWLVRVIDAATTALVHHDKLDIEQARRREAFVDGLLGRLGLPEDQVAAKRAVLLTAFEAAVATIIQEEMAAAGDDEADDEGADPVIKNYTKVIVDKSPEFVGLSPQQITEQLHEVTGGFPKRADVGLFALGRDHEVVELGSPASLFAWMRRQARVDWQSGPSLMTPEQFHADLAMNAEAFDAVEVLPHHPPMPRVCYSHPPIPAAPAGLLGQLLAMFSPSTEEDRDLILAMILTLFWGGEAGSRPAFLVTGPDEDDHRRGRGVGKSKLPEVIADELAGGLIEVTPSDDIAGVKTRLLSRGATQRRAIRLDNIKSKRLSWSDLEALLTTSVISGKALYRGEGRRPNTLTWFLTLNSPGLGKDIAQRVIPAKLARPPLSATWEADTRRFLRENRWPLIGEIIGLLRSETATIAPRTRWGAWEQGVLGKVGRVAGCQELIVDRQHAMDVDEDETEAVAEYIASSLRSCGHDPEAERVKIRGPILCHWLGEATGERISQTTYKRRLKELNLPRLKEYK
jgi:hypothetical protein